MESEGVGFESADGPDLGISDATGHDFRTYFFDDLCFGLVGLPITYQIDSVDFSNMQDLKVRFGIAASMILMY
jgi:hypothetical protein